MEMRFTGSRGVGRGDAGDVKRMNIVFGVKQQMVP